VTHAPFEHFHHAPQASRELGWEPYRDAAQICKDTWRWFNANPNGYIKPDKEFGAFKQASFQKSSMPKLSSSSRESSRKPPPAPSAQHSDRVSRNSRFLLPLNPFLISFISLSLSLSLFLFHSVATNRDVPAEASISLFLSFFLSRRLECCG